MPSAVRSMVWVVDDSPLDAERVRQAVTTEQDLEVVVFTDAAAALEALGSAGAAGPVVVVVDWMMPGISGLDVCRFLKGPGSPHVRVGVLLLTAQAGSEQIVEGLSAGADDFVSKPFVDAELRARLRALVRQRELLVRAERAEELNRRLLDSTPDPLFALDGQGRVTFANPAAARAFGPEQLRGVPIHELVPGLPPAVHECARVAADVILDDVVIGDRTFSPTVRGAEGEGGCTLSLRDVTERRAADKRRLDFYSIIAHDLRSPLSAIMLRTDLMLRGQHGMLAPRLVTDIRKIDENLKSLLAMINDFLDLARLENTGMKLEKNDVELSALVTKVMEDFRPLLDANGLAWEPRRTPAALVEADKRRLVQVLTNLVGNAIKFTPPGGVIYTDVVIVEGNVEVSVADTGRGIAADALPHLFQRYTRVLDDEHEVAGTGLGLMIVREIVEAHRGSVGVESTPGSGSRFWFRLPRRVPTRALRAS